MAPKLCVWVPGCRRLGYTGETLLCEVLDSPVILAVNIFSVVDEELEAVVDDALCASDGYICDDFLALDAEYEEEGIYTL